MTRIIWCQKLFKSCTKDDDGNWNYKYMDSEHDWYHKFVTTVHPTFQQSFPVVRLSGQRTKDKPWIDKGLCIRHHA